MILGACLATFLGNLHATNVSPTDELQGRERYHITDPDGTEHWVQFGCVDTGTNCTLKITTPSFPPYYLRFSRPLSAPIWTMDGFWNIMGTNWA
jgi:hypothetical protein